MFKKKLRSLFGYDILVKWLRRSSGGRSMEEGANMKNGIQRFLFKRFSPKNVYFMVFLVLAAGIAAAFISCIFDEDLLLDLTADVHTGGIRAGTGAQLLDGLLFIQAGNGEFTVTLDNERRLNMRVKLSGTGPGNVQLDPADISFFDTAAAQLRDDGNGFCYLPAPAQNVVVRLQNVTAGDYRLTLELKAGDWGRIFDPRVISAAGVVSLPIVAKRSGGYYYSTLPEAVNAAGGTSGSPDLITILADVNMGAGITIPAGKHLSLAVPAGQTRTLLRDSSSSPFTGSFFDIAGGGSLILSAPAGASLVLDGNGNLVTAQTELVKVNGSGKFTLKNGAVLRNNKRTTGDGGAVVNNGVFIMEGGKITGNQAGSGGGGVYSNGSFTLSGGEITANRCEGSGDTAGGGVNIGGNPGDPRTFTMSGGIISHNECNSSGYGSAQGGGVLLYGTFNLYGGTISENSVSSSSYYAQGGGVYTTTSPNFVMWGGVISGNSAGNGGGGVYIYSTTSTFTMRGGVIYGTDAADSTLRNTTDALNAGYDKAKYGDGNFIYPSGSSTSNTIRGHN
jgi:hypothetical protein